MAELKHKKLILTDLVVPDDVKEKAIDYNKRATRILWMEDFIIHGSPNIILMILMKLLASLAMMHKILVI
jgi:hypothetical protein